MKRKNTNKGITLIALVITIIVMLILVSVTISMAINGGLFEYAGKATGDTQNAINMEQELANGKVQIDGKWYASIDDYLAGKVLVELPEGIKVGDYVNYTPTAGTYKVADGDNGSGYTTDAGYQEFTTDSSLKWRILSIDEETGEIELVSATAVHSLTLKGANGYNHAVDILNDLCEELYSNENGATARSINVEDINAKTTYDYQNFEYTIANGVTYKYGQQIPLSQFSSSYRKYPNLYSKETGYAPEGTVQTGLEGSEGLKDGVTDKSEVTTYPTVSGYTDDSTSSKDVYVTYTYYGYNGRKYTYYPENCLDTSLGINTAPAGLIKLSSSYWLASRCVGASSTYANFYVRYMNSSGYVNDHTLFFSRGSTGSPSYAVRPVVSLGSNVSLTKDTTNTTSTTTYWNVEF